VCRKALVAGVAVVVALLAVNFVFPRTFSFIRLWVHDAREAADESVPPEQEIARLKLELNQLGKEDDRHFHKVAVQVVEVQKLEKQVAAMKERLDTDATTIRARKASLASKGDFVSYGGKEYDRVKFTEELRQMAARFQVEDEEYKSKEEQLGLRKRTLEANRKKLAELQLVRQQMKTELERLEAALAEERQSQAREQNTLDDSNYQKLRGDVNNVRDRLEVLKQKRVLKGEVNGPVRANEERKAKEDAIDKFLNEDPRFNGVSKDKQ